MPEDNNDAADDDALVWEKYAIVMDKVTVLLALAVPPTLDAEYALDFVPQVDDADDDALL